MSIILNNALTDQYANSYCDVNYADSYWTDHYNQTKAAQWLALTNQQKINLLVEACRVIETVRFTQNILLRDG